MEKGLPIRDKQSFSLYTVEIVGICYLVSGAA